MTTGSAKSIQRIARYLAALVLCLTALAVFVPLEPLMPVNGLDKSWMMAMNQGVVQGLVFGRDIIFTFGPYASIYTELYHPATDKLMVLGSSFLGLSYALLLLLLGKDEKIYKLMLYGIFLACFIDSRDALFFSCPLIISLVVYRMTLPDDHSLHLHFAKPIEYCFALLFSLLGLLPLIKGSLLPNCAITAALCSAILWLRGNKSLACMSLGIPGVSCALLWRFSGQSISALPSFFWNMRQIISGYTEAMAFPGDMRECVIYALASVLMILFIGRTARGPKSSKWYLCISYSLFLFIAFKSGFVRHDEWHNITAATSILAASLLLIFVLDGKSSLLPLAMAALVWAYVGGGTVQTIADGISQNLRGTFERVSAGARIRFRENGGLQKRYGEHLAAISAKFPIPRMAGTTDIYSFNQSWILASGNTWAPRPVTQSYSAYTPELAELNLRHLQDANAPDNIVFRLEPIDGRLPSLEDGLSWPTLINDYSVRKLERQSAYLQKRTTLNNSSPPAGDDFYNGRHKLGQEVTLPESSDPLFANIDIQPTFPGRILSALFKPPELHITMRLRDGRVANYRVISNMMKTDFLITPLVKYTEEFALLAAGGNKYLAGNEVKTITISAEDENGLFWNKAYSLHLRKLNLLKNTDLEDSLLFDKMGEAMPARLSASPAQVCEGTIGTVNGTLPESGIQTMRNALSVQGWMTLSGKDGIVPDIVFVTLTSEGGKTVYVKARRAPRDDVRLHFNQPGMPDPGFTILLDVSPLHGRYTLGLARTYKGNLEICQQFKLPILFDH